MQNDTQGGGAAQPPNNDLSSHNPLILKLQSLSTLSEDDRAALQRLTAHAETAGPNTDLIREGDAPDGVYLIIDGMACRYKRRANGARQITAYLLPGDFCDLDVALLEAMDHSIATLSDCKFVRMPLAAVKDILEGNPRLTAALRVATLVDEATLREWLVNVGCRTTEERIAHLFCELFLRLQVVGKASEGGFALPLTFADLADTTGTSAVHVSRALQSLRAKGLLTLQDGWLQIVDVAGLKHLAEFKANYLHLEGRAVA